MRTTSERRTTISLSPPSRPRLLLRPPHPPGLPPTPVDGAWWPRSADPVAELPGLILALQSDTSHTSIDAHADGRADRAGDLAERAPITYILLRKGDWDGNPRRLRIGTQGDARVVRVGWFETLPAGLLTAIWADGRRIDLLTIPAGIHHAAACTLLEMAADVANHFRTPDFLAALATAAGKGCLPEARMETESIWETEGIWETESWESVGGRPPRLSPAGTSVPANT